MLEPVGPAHVLSPRVRRHSLIRASGVPVVVGLAVHEIEAWMVSVPAARRLAIAGAHDARLDADVEAIEDPRSLWSKLCGEAATGGGTAAPHERRAAAWAAIDPDVVARACPRGFAPFLAAL